MGDALHDSFSLELARTGLAEKAEKAAEMFFTALAIVLFWGVLMASTQLLVKAALGHPDKEREVLNVSLLVSLLFSIGVIFLPNYRKWWWVWLFILYHCRDACVQEVAMAGAAFAALGGGGMATLAGRWF